MGKTIKKLEYALIANAMLVFANLSSCGQQAQVNIQQNKSNVLVSKKEYTKDSIYLYYVLERMLRKNTEPYTPSNYYGPTTIIYLDSILYSPDKLRFIVFSVTQNGKREKSLIGGKSDYNGNYLFCERTTTDSTIKVFNYGPLKLAHYDSYDELKLELRDLVFRRRSGDRWSDNQPKYNMDDKRFWYSDEFNSVASSTLYTWLK